MTRRLARLLGRMTVEQLAELEDFASFLLVRSHLRPTLATDDIQPAELLRVVAAGGAFDWLADEAEDIYTAEEGEPVQWPKAS